MIPCPAHQIPDGCGMAPDIQEFIQDVGHERLTCPDCRLATNRAEAERRRATGERPRVSTGIHGCLTYGYGKLDENGFWEFPLPDGEQVEYT